MIDSQPGRHGIHNLLPGRHDCCGKQPYLYGHGSNDAYHHQLPVHDLVHCYAVGLSRPDGCARWTVFYFASTPSCPDFSSPACWQDYKCPKSQSRPGRWSCNGRLVLRCHYFGRCYRSPVVKRARKELWFEKE